MLSTGIERRKSSPNEHQQNGKVERYVRIMEERVASMHAAAPWVPKRFVTLQILLWVHIWNLQSGENESISSNSNLQTEDLQRSTMTYKGHEAIPF